MQSLWKEAVIFAGESQEAGCLIRAPESRWDPAMQKCVAQGAHCSIIDSGSLDRELLLPKTIFLQEVKWVEWCLESGLPLFIQSVSIY